MNADHDRFDDVLALADAFLMDRATEEDLAHLAELLENDESARRMYVERIEETISLRKWSCSQLEQQMDGALSLEDDRLSVEVPTQVGRSKSRFVTRLTTHIRTHPLRSAAAGVLATCIAWIVFFKVLFPLADPTNPDQPNDQIAAGSDAAVLRLAWNCRWREGADVIEQGSALKPGQVIDIEDGTIEIVFEGGVKVLLEGRTRFAVQSSSIGQLDIGRLYAHVPREAVGFEIETPSAAIRDLGTEFGLAVGEQGTTELHVTVGAVAIAKGDLSNLSNRSHRVDAGQAVRVTGGEEIERVEDSKTVSGKFARLVRIAKRPELLLPEDERTPPADGLRLWLAADANVKTDERGFVFAWADARETADTELLSATQTSADLRPMLSAEAIFGKPAIRFDGAHALQLPTPEALGVDGSDYEMFIVAQSRSNNTQFLISGATENFELHINGDAGARFIPAAPYHPERASDVGLSGDYSNGQPLIFSARVDSSKGGRGVVRVNGVDSTDFTTALSGMPQNDALRLGARARQQLPFSGEIAEVLIYSRSLTAKERQQVEVYLGLKYRIVRKRSQIRPTRS